MTDYHRILRHSYAKVVVGIVLVIAIFLGFFFGLGLVLETSAPLRVVDSGSMCTSMENCDGYTQPFAQTLHYGDVIVIQGVKAGEINANYPNSDIIVYQDPENSSATPIVHRVVAEYEINGTWYFQTKGDGNGTHWPAAVNESEYDSHQIWFTGQGVPENLVLGRVAMRIPYLGWITLFMHNNNWVLSLVIAVIIALIVIEFILPAARAQRQKKRAQEQNNTSKKP